MNADKLTKQSFIVMMFVLAGIISLAIYRVYQEPCPTSYPRDLNYEVILDDAIYIVDPISGETIYSEDWESGSPLVEAILKDNQ